MADGGAAQPLVSQARWTAWLSTVTSWRARQYAPEVVPSTETEIVKAACQAQRVQRETAPEWVARRQQVEARRAKQLQESRDRLPASPVRQHDPDDLPREDTGAAKKPLSPGTPTYDPRGVGEYTALGTMGPEMHVVVCAALKELWPNDDDLTDSWARVRPGKPAPKVGSSTKAPKLYASRSGKHGPRISDDWDMAVKELHRTLRGCPDDDRAAWQAVRAAFFAWELTLPDVTIQRATYPYLIKILPAGLKHGELAIWMRDHVTAERKGGHGRYTFGGMATLLLDPPALIKKVRRDWPALADRLAANAAPLADSIAGKLARGVYRLDLSGRLRTRPAPELPEWVGKSRPVSLHDDWRAHRVERRFVGPMGTCRCPECRAGAAWARSFLEIDNVPSV